MPTNNAINANTAGLVRYNGTGTFDAVTTTNHAVLVGSTSNGITNLTVGTNGQVLVGASAADPAFATLTSTAGSLTYTTGANTLNIDVANFASSTWTPTVVGEAVTGTTSYTTQQGYYVRFLNLVYIEAYMVITGATGTGNALFGGFPFTVKNQSNYVPIGNISLASAAWAWTGTGTQLNLRPILNTTTARVDSLKSAGAANLAMTNGAATFVFSCLYQV